MSTLNEREALLRRALHAAADAIEPQGDGLQRIQARLRRPRPLPLAWAEAVWTDVRLRAPAILQSWLQRLLGAFGLAWERFGPTRRSGGRGSRTLGWLRPVAALGVTVFVVAAGAYVAIDAQQAIFPSASSSSHSTGGGGAGGGSSTGSSGPNALSQSSLAPGLSRPPARSTRCKATKPATSPSASGSIAQIQSPSSSASPSDTVSPSPSPSITDTSSPSTAASGQATTAPIAPVSPSPGMAGAAQTSVLIPAATVSPPPCGKKKPVRHNPVIQANALLTPAAISVGRLNDGS